MPPSSSRWIWIVVLLALALGGVWLLRSRAAQTQSSAGAVAHSGHGSAVPVAVAPVRLGDIAVYQDGLGSVTPYYMVTIHTRIDGQLMNVYYREGQYVKEGAMLAEIDPRPYQVQLEQAEGQLAKDQATLANARIDLSRYQTLIKQDAIPQQTLDTQVATVLQDEGVVKTDQAAIDNSKLNLTYCRITAPISGVVGLRLVDPGNMVHAADTNGLLVITQIQPITVIFTLPEDGLPPVLKKLRAGLTLTADAYNRDKSQKLASGRLSIVDNQVDPTTGTIRLRAEFANRDNALFPQQFVNTRLLVDTERNQVLVPSVAIQRGAVGTFVYVLKTDKTVDARPVTIGISEGGNTSIINDPQKPDEGLKPGEQVVIDGADKLQPGSKVSIPASSPHGGPGNSGGHTGGSHGNSAGGPAA